MAVYIVFDITVLYNIAKNLKNGNKMKV